MPFQYPVHDYATLREESYRNAHALIKDAHVGIGAITVTDAMDANRWPTIAYFEGRDDWKWLDLWSYYRAAHSRRFEVCVKYLGLVCGFGIGRPSKRKTQMGLDFVQGNPARNHPLKRKVFPLVLLAANEYARVIGAIDVRVYNPDHDLLPYYSRFGLRYVQKAVGLRGADYMTMPVQGSA